MTRGKEAARRISDWAYARRRKAYERLRKVPVLSGFVWDVRKIYEIMRPASEREILQSTMRVVEKCAAAALGLVLLALWMRGASPYAYLILFSLFFMACGQVVSESLWKEEYALLTQLEKYLGDVRHYYHIGGMVEEAIYDSLEDAPYEVSLQMQRAYDALTSEEEGAAEKYKETAPNKFFKIFFDLCRITMEYGDTVREGKSLFLANLNYLRGEIHIEILKKDKIRFTFSGLVFLAVFPSLFLKLIEDFGISNLPELSRYYRGRYGILTTMAIFLATVGAYLLINALREERRAVPREHRLLRRWVQAPWVRDGLSRYFFRHPRKVRNVERLLRNTGNEMSVGELFVEKAAIFAVASALSVLVFVGISRTEAHNAIWDNGEWERGQAYRQSEEVRGQEEWIGKGADYYKRETVTEGLGERISAELVEAGAASDEETAAKMAGEILRRVLEYQKGGVPLWCFPLGLLIGLVLAQVPTLLLEIKGFFLKNEIEDEVMQFQTIVVMLMHIPQMTVETILEWMEHSSEVFLESILECEETYSFDQERALGELKEKEPFPSFVMLVEDMEACDRVGIEEAFDEIAGQRSYFSEKRKQDNEMWISNKGVIGKLAAYLPGTMVIGLYLILPFVMESLTQLSAYIAEMEIF